MRLFLLSAGLLSLLCFQSQNIYAQCSAGEVSVTIDVHTDGFGYEAYWQLLPGTNNCGVGTIFAGGNPAVGCNGGGAQNQATGGYGNDMTITEGPFCLVDGNDYKIFHTDDWGDGGTEFDVYVNSYKISSYAAIGAVESWTFKAQEPEDYDGSAVHVQTPQYVVQGQNAVKGEVKNVGKLNWSSIEILYSIDNGTAVSETFSGINVANDESFEFEFTSKWDVSTSGNYLLKFWIGDINGSADQNTANNELSQFITVSPPIPNIIDQFFSSNYVFEEIVSTLDQVSVPRDLDFHPNYALKQLWIINKGSEPSGGSTVIVDNAGETDQMSQYVQDGNAWHFMSLPTAIDFSNNGNFATTPGVQDANHSGGTFTGPSLWPSDLSIYGIVGNPPSASFNGSHLDMLHGSPYSMGIAHEKENVFWVFDSHNQEIVRYDFKEDHGPGKDYHGDAEVRRYPEAVVNRNGTHIPNHMVIDKSTGWLYIVENLNNRVMRLDINSGSKFQDLPPINEPLAVHEEYTGVSLQISIQNLNSPSGIEIIDDRLLVGEYGTGDIIAYDLSSGSPVEIGSISTGATELMGIKIGPNGNIWYVDASSNSVHKIVSDGPPTAVEEIDELPVRAYPNPTTEKLIVEHTGLNVNSITIYNTEGRSVMQFDEIENTRFEINVKSLPAGSYLMHYQTAEGVFSYKFNKVN